MGKSKSKQGDAGDLFDALVMTPAQWMASQRWKGTTARERREYASKIGKLGGRPRQADRCPCGLYTLHTAKLRHHHCERPAKKKSK